MSGILGLRYGSVLVQELVRPMHRALVRHFQLLASIGQCMAFEKVLLRSGLILMDAEIKVEHDSSFFSWWLRKFALGQNV